MGCGAISNSQSSLKLIQYNKKNVLCQSTERQIWQCENGQKQKFIVKIFKNIFVTEQSQKMFNNFSQQIKRLRSLTQGISPNQNLIKYVKAWKDQNNNLALVMQFQQNKSLGDLVKGKLSGLFDEVTIAQICQKICKALKFLRQKGSIFCNIKPSNVFVSKDFKNVILSDFYNLQQYFCLSQQSFKKNPVYTAPQNARFNQYFQQSDVWRIGCLVIQLLTCIKPWYKEIMNLQVIFNKIKSQQSPPIPQKISINCKDFLTKCLQTDHNRRISLQSLLKHPFIKENLSKTSQVKQQCLYERQNTSKQQIGSYNIQIENLDIVAQKIFNKNNPKSIEIDFSPTKVMRKKTYQQLKQSNSLNRSNIQVDNIQTKANILTDKKYKFRTKRFKTQNQIVNESKKFLNKNNKQTQYIWNDINCESPKLKKSSTKKVSRTTDFIISTSKSKKKICQNKITLNNQVILSEISSTKHYQSNQIPSVFNFCQTTKNLSQILKQIEATGPTYYKKPLRLLKKKLRQKMLNIKTQTSITCEDSRMKYLNEIQQINIQSMTLINLNDNQNHTQQSYQTYQSKISRTRDQQHIETAVSKAERNRYLTEQRYIRQHRETEKQKWERELNEGREFIRNQINHRYHFSKAKAKVKLYDQ